MNIVVCVKQVPDTKDVKINLDTNNIVRNGVQSIMNPYDENALEEGLKLRDEKGGSVTVISMGPNQAVEMLQQALDMGADRAILLSDHRFAGSDTLATGYTLSCLIRKLKADVVLCGSEAVDGCTGQVGPIIAENLGWPQITYVCNIQSECNRIVFRRETREGYEIYTCKAPFVACVLKGINHPRTGSPSSYQPEVLSADDVAFDMERLGMNGSPTRVASILTSGRSVNSFISTNGNLPAHERIRMIINGGIEARKIRFVRGAAEKLANIILSENKLRGYTKMKNGGVTR